jgi:hypothetical protein
MEQVGVEVTQSILVGILSSLAFALPPQTLILALPQMLAMIFAICWKFPWQFFCTFGVAPVQWEFLSPS